MRCSSHSYQSQSQGKTPLGTCSRNTHSCWWSTPQEEGEGLHTQEQWTHTAWHGASQLTKHNDEGGHYGPNDTPAISTGLEQCEIHRDVGELGTWPSKADRVVSDCNGVICVT